MTIDEAIKREKEIAADFRSRAEYFCTVEIRKLSKKMQKNMSKSQNG